MDIVSYGDFRIPDMVSNDFRSVDCECASCLYEAGKLALSDALAAVINNELTETERIAVQKYWFNGEKISHIAAFSGISADAVRKSLKRAQKKYIQALNMWFCTTVSSAVTINCLKISDLKLSDVLTERS